MSSTAMSTVPDRTLRQRATNLESHIILSKGVLRLGSGPEDEAQRYHQHGKPVVWVEALPDAHQRLSGLLHAFANQRALCALLGERDGEQKSLSTGGLAEHPTGQVVPMPQSGEADMPPARAVTLPTLRVDTLLSVNGVDPALYNFWVVDLQGAELEALKGATRHLQKCRALVVKVRDIEGGGCWSALKDWLYRQGFEPLWLPEQPRDDVLFVRKDVVVAQARIRFGGAHYERHNQRRLEHLASLDLDLDGKRVLEVGAGIGDHTGFYTARGCSVVCTEVRPELLMVLADHFADNPLVDVRALDMDDPEDLGERFDVIHCYGLLYHLGNPAQAIKFLSDHCSGKIVLETCVSFGDEFLENTTPESQQNFSQAFYGQGCRPTRPWIWRELQKYIPFVYSTAKQPMHEEFPVSWVIPSTSELNRAVFVASRDDIQDNKNLLPYLPDRHEY